jgi:hypothetical protein
VAKRRDILHVHERLLAVLYQEMAATALPID